MDFQETPEEALHRAGLDYRQKKEIKQLRRIIAALVYEIQGLQQTAFVSDLDLDADPPKLRFQRSELERGYHVFLD